MVLYGAKGVVFDFGIHIDAVSPFFLDRGDEARKWVREIRLARWLSVDEAKTSNLTWSNFCHFTKHELLNLRSLELTILVQKEIYLEDQADPLVVNSESETKDKQREVEKEKKYREWEIAHDILQAGHWLSSKFTFFDFGGKGEGEALGRRSE